MKAAGTYVDIITTDYSCDKEKQSKCCDKSTHFSAHSTTVVIVVVAVV